MNIQIKFGSENSGLQNSGLLKGGLVLSLITQVLVSIICLSIAISMSFIPFINGIVWAIFAISICAVALSSASIHNVNNARFSRAKYSKGLAIFAGIIALFSTFIGGILILVGASSAYQPKERRRDRYEDERPFGRPSREEYRQRRSGRSRYQDEEEDYRRRR